MNTGNVFRITMLLLFVLEISVAVTAIVRAQTKLLPVMPVPGKIASEKKMEEIGTTELMLSNGVKVVLKPTPFQKDRVLFRSFSPGGTSLVPDENYFAASLAAQVITGSGVVDFNARELSKILAGKNITVAPYIGEITEGINGSSSTGDLETAFQLLYLYFTAPGKDPVFYESFTSRLRLSLENPANTPEAVFNDTIRAVLGNHHFRRSILTAKALGEINLDKIWEIYKDRFADASDFTFVFVGNFDVETIKPLLAQYLGSLPVINRKEQGRDFQLDYPAGRIARKVIKGKEPRSTVLLLFGGAFNYTDQDVLQLDALAAVLTMRLQEELREEEAGLYSIQIRPGFRKLPTGEYTMNIRFSCDPQRAEILILTIHREIHKIKTEGALQPDIARFRAAQKSTLENQLKENAFWLNYLYQQLFHGDDPKELLEYTGKLEQVTPESLKMIAEKYLRNDNYLRFLLVPEMK